MAAKQRQKLTDKASSKLSFLERSVNLRQSNMEGYSEDLIINLMADYVQTRQTNVWNLDTKMYEIYLKKEKRLKLSRYFRTKELFVIMIHPSMKADKKDREIF